ncbi:VWA domain-containing protein [Roseivirga sp. BDSF3-8]|uniref:vWA domain-containing protein n=1 Tax=Roseivirga sp. BDSF3-8 TaxID=3241598 RepID=UPI003531A0C6
MAQTDFFSAESPENYEQKSICCFVVDVSGSMGGTPINQLNIGLQEFHQEILNDSTTSNRLEIAIVEFSSSVETVVPPSLVDSFSMPTLNVKGSTKLVDGVNAAIDLVESRKKWYKDTGQPYLRPWIILITDGAPDSGQDINGLASRIEISTKSKNFLFLPIGVEGADMNVLNTLAGYTSDGSGGWKKTSAMKLQGLKFSDFFKWVSASMSIVAGSQEGDKVTIPSTGDWLDTLEI